MTKIFSFPIILFLLGCTFSFASGGENSISIANAKDSLSAKDVWNNYIKALGGADNLKKVEDRATIMESQINGQNIVITIYQKAPDKMKQIITTSSITQNIYYDGRNGVMEVGGKKMDITGKELEKLKFESMMNFIINIDSLGIKLRLVGNEKVNGKNCYKIETLLPSGSKIVQYFDMKTWLMVKRIENVIAAQKTYVQETYFDDYREVRGVKYPFSIKESLGAQSMDITVTSIKVNEGLDDSLFVIK